MMPFAAVAPARNARVPDDRAILTCRNLWKVFGLRAGQALPPAAALAAHGLVPAVQDVSLDIRVGEIFVIMGLSGSGKSTLVRCLSRLVTPSAGSVLFDGKDLAAVGEREMVELRRHKMGMVFQHFALLPHRSVADNVAFPLEVQGVAPRERLRRAHQLLELVGLAGKERAFPHQLSGGQQQRVGIARSLAVEPEIWFLDEPFSALDPLIRGEMQAEFLRLQSLLRKSIVFITHDFTEAIRLADRIAIMKEGAVVQVGTPEDLVLNPRTDYVAEFTKDVARARVLSVGAVMQPQSGATASGEEPVAAGERVQSVAERVLAARRPLPVHDGSGHTVGEISGDVVIRVLLNQA